MVAEKGEIWAGHMVHMVDMLFRVSVRLVFYTLKPYTGLFISLPIEVTLNLFQL